MTEDVVSAAVAATHDKDSSSDDESLSQSNDSQPRASQEEKRGTISGLLSNRNSKQLIEFSEIEKSNFINISVCKQGNGALRILPLIPLVDRPVYSIGARRRPGHDATNRPKRRSIGTTACSRRRNDVSRCNCIDMHPYDPLCANMTSSIKPEVT